MLHCNHCIQSGTIGPCCMESTAFKHAAWNPLHSIGMLWAMLDNIHCIQSGFFGPRCLESTAFNHAAWNPLHSIMLHNLMRPPFQKSKKEVGCLFLCGQHSPTQLKSREHFSKHF